MPRPAAAVQFLSKVQDTASSACGPGPEPRTRTVVGRSVSYHTISALLLFFSFVVRSAGYLTYPWTCLFLCFVRVYYRVCCSFVATEVLAYRSARVNSRGCSLHTTLLFTLRILYLAFALQPFLASPLPL